MVTLAANPKVVRAELNFAADRSDGGIWSNNDPSVVTQALESCAVDIHDASARPDPPTLDVEGFTRVLAPVGEHHWADAEWVRDIYLPHAVELVRTLSGADDAVVLHPSVLIRDTGDATKATAAAFVHLDQTRDSVLPFFDSQIDAATRADNPRLKIFNVWRSITPPPQDVPLALCDQRTLIEADCVAGRTVATGIPDGIAYLAALYAPEHRWSYFSGLTPDDAVVFKGYDSDRSAPMGCLHGAFRRPELAGVVPRASAETRVIAIFDAPSSEARPRA